ncbi:glycosyltransferase family 2 protein [Streptomyces sp. AK02-04a]|uniref:glycosyltransferase family 2 protein n=1 Tax=Streptomyces sp. AK02-04a TaxID=3028649 RepID=UPI0029A7DB44|nr:glycosyltransferase family 2 protein [Streptomyces sp. AK02-04a]MDX3763422.1 glycosyltransferase family 2 protein [Streptomyces sp. AK02-04a]
MNQFQESGFVGLSMALALVVSTTFALYVILLVIAYLRAKPQPPGDANDFAWHFFIPCRDEESVIGDTLLYLQEHFRGVHLWVIDDDSDDDTAAIVHQHAERSSHMHLVQRRRPYARTGKSHALNAAYQALDEWLPADVDRTSVVVSVFDADARPSTNLLDVCAGPSLFGDPKMGAVQIEVRMVNRNIREPLPGGTRLQNWFGRTLVRLQDIEFRSAITAIQISRRITKSVCMGGNGQLSRMSSLDELAGHDREPWRGSLLEDFELGLHIMLAGYHTGYATEAWVDQEALYNLPRFMTQRTRWCQGTMQCMRYLSKTWRSPHLTNFGVVEISYYLIQPWIWLVGTVIYPLPILIYLNNLVLYPEQTLYFLQNGGAVEFTLYLLFGVAQFAVWGYLYQRRCEPSLGLLRCIGWGIAYATMIYLFYVIAWRAFGRLLIGRAGWAKTRRNAEVHILGQPVAKDA